MVSFRESLNSRRASWFCTLQYAADVQCGCGLYNCSSEDPEALFRSLLVRFGLAGSLINMAVHQLCLLV